MSEELYITGPVIVNGIPDSDGDTLNSVEIRTIFTKYTNHLSDIQHDRIDYEGVDVLANWISEEDTTIKGNTIPAKSWLCTMKVTDPETLTAIEKGELTCFSLGSVSATGKTRKAWFIDKRISYHDLKSMDEVIPLRISIVDKGANGFPFEIENREVYINKNKGTDNMTKENMQDTEAKFSFKEWLGIEKHFKNNNIDKAEDAEPTPAPAPKKEEETDSAEKNIQALFDKIDALAAEIAEIKEALTVDVDKAKDDKIKEESEEKPEKTEEAETNEEKEENKTSETKKQEEAEKQETDINKSVTTKPADKPQINESQSNFYKNTGRDAFGRKIRR